jgi:hypothetical protein
MIRLLNMRAATLLASLKLPVAPGLRQEEERRRRRRSRPSDKVRSTRRMRRRRRRRKKGTGSADVKEEEVNSFCDC